MINENISQGNKKMNFRKANEFPTEAQKEMNNGMTVKKVNILRSRMDHASAFAKAGRISWAQSLRITTIAVRDIRILVGAEEAYLQG
jgi:capsular polysaccharide biosynthesis protein